jgi:nitrogen fixation NifU-like protein
MTDLRELYQQVIIEHSRHPRNYKELETASHRAEGYNPLCGDQITVYIEVEDGLVKDVTFLGSGCAISKASASLMTGAVKGKTVEEAEALFARFRAMLTSGHDAEIDEGALGKLTVLSGVREFPVRVKCATLAWHTLHAALQEKDEPVTTE